MITLLYSVAHEGRVSIQVKGRLKNHANFETSVKKVRSSMEVERILSPTIGWAVRFLQAPCVLRYD